MSKALKVTITKVLNDEFWGWSYCMDGREIDDENCQKELINLILEDPSEIIIDGLWKLELIDEE